MSAPGGGGPAEHRRRRHVRSSRAPIYRPKPQSFVLSGMNAMAKMTASIANPQRIARKSCQG